MLNVNKCGRSIVYRSYSSTDRLDEFVWSLKSFQIARLFENSFWTVDHAMPLRQLTLQQYYAASSTYECVARASRTCDRKTADHGRVWRQRLKKSYLLKIAAWMSFGRCADLFWWRSHLALASGHDLNCNCADSPGTESTLWGRSCARKIKNIN